MNIQPSQFLNITKKLRLILESEIRAANVPPGEAVILNFRDPNYGPETGGYHPVEIMVSGDGVVQYITDFSYVGAPPFAELAKELDFDLQHKVFQQMGRDYPIESGRGLYRMWQANFCAYYEMGVYQVETTTV